MITIRSTYKEYRGLGGKINRTDYMKLCGLFCKFLVKNILEGNKTGLPHSLGYIQVVGVKNKPKFINGIIKNLPPNWTETKKLWDKSETAKENKTLVYHENDHTDGFRYKFLWIRKNIRNKYKSSYSLKMSRENKRTLWKNILQGKGYTI